MESLPQLIERARDGQVEAYGQIVRRFQDMAVGYAYSLLGDFHLAEDAAQEAFAHAYACLDQLHSPAAFPQWFRRVVASRCQRLQRGRTLDTVSLEKAASVPTGEPGPSELLEGAEARRQIEAALSVLPENQRTVVALFYMGGQSQQAIGAFLQVPVQTVKNRLFAARKKLKEELLHSVGDELQEQRPSRTPRFSCAVIKQVFHRSRYSTALGSFEAALAKVDDTWPLWRLAGLFGHAFIFSMRRSGGEVYQQANLDWWALFRRLDGIDRQVQIFEGSVKGTNKKTEDQLQALKEQAWSAVRRSIDRGIPAIAWTPMTLEQRDAGLPAWDWQLLVGYDESAGTYTVRLGPEREYQVGYDQFGRVDPVQWFCVIVLGAGRPVERRRMEVEALQWAVALARGRAWEAQEAPYRADAVGLEAYALWHPVLRDGDLSCADSHAAFLCRARDLAAGGCVNDHPHLFLCRARDLAAQYLQDLAGRYPEAPSLGRAAAEYAEEARETALLSVLLGDARGQVRAAERRRFVELLDRALAAEERAVGHLEAALGELSQ